MREVHERPGAVTHGAAVGEGARRGALSSALCKHWKVDCFIYLKKDKTFCRRGFSAVRLKCNTQFLLHCLISGFSSSLVMCWRFCACCLVSLHAERLFVILRVFYAQLFGSFAESKLDTRDRVSGCGSGNKKSTYLAAREPLRVFLRCRFSERDCVAFTATLRESSHRHGRGDL